ncbi:Outer membrane protein assembly factor BamB precursor [Hartmannibacter diazotrophicus]|uniref:Outer membrane protein assembly factor BamB n=1 Tax=Hartmannibacter diazotrophicus TaxID=1482074 RepID=A0A2C9D9E7_9HYPH|nr:PQQ-binding-like beta-propeller repeat protein [Hartmannibacter diazotrophicus]SON56361.1 Outer membrane protein assembly factor BamB precursor [Hartmannibacter diazotrophicus]
MSDRRQSRSLRVAVFNSVALALVAGSLAGCTSGIDSLSELNPFKGDEKLLQGERRSLRADGALPEVANTTASYGAARDIGDWPQSGGTAANDPGNIAYSGSGRLAWSVKAGQTGESGGAYGFYGADQRVSARPVVSGGTVFTYDPTGNVTAINLSSGGRVWSANIRPKEEGDTVNGGGVAATGGRVFVSTGYGEVVGLDAGSGARVWTAKLDAPARSAPAVSGGKVFVVTRTNSVIAIDAAAGSVLWTVETNSAAASLLATASPAVVGDTVIVPTSTGDIAALSIADGSQKWSVSVSGGSRSLAVAGLGDASASPVVDNGVLFATGIGGRTIAAKAQNGEQIWSQPIGSAHTPVVSGSSVFIVDLDGRAVAFDRSKGTILWATQLPKNPDAKRTTWAGPLLGNGKLWLVSVHGRLARVDAATGTLEQTSKLNVEGVLPPIASGGTMLILGGQGNLIALR